MTKTKTAFVCQDCGANFPKWTGQCTTCSAWNTIVEEKIKPEQSGFVQYQTPTPIIISEVDLAHEPRMSTCINELDRVLGGGVIFGSTILIGGDPGIGKSTLLLQTLANLSKSCNVLYVTGEESLQQIALRAKRLNLHTQNLHLLTETNTENIIANIAQIKPQVVVIDSMQTIYTDTLQSAPGSIGQVRESAAQLVRHAKQTNTAIFIIGHVTKEGMLAGPKVLEHMVDCVLYFEGALDNRYRMIRAIKNRFGAVNELGIFAMTDTGLKEVTNPSAIFLSRDLTTTPGSVVTATWEGSRPLLVEVQALVAKSYLTNPRRVTVGIEHNRLAMLLAVLHRHGKIPTYDQDVFINIVGGVKIIEPAVDLALLMAIISSLHNTFLPNDLIAFGEVGLSGEIRPVQNGQERLKEAIKHGFKHAIMPKANVQKKTQNIEIKGINNISELNGLISQCKT